MAKKYVLDGYLFANAADFERAKKEQETIQYLTANTNMADMKALYKLYKMSVEKKSFQTIFGLQYLEEIRKRLIGSGVVEKDLLEPIPVQTVMEKKAKEPGYLNNADQTEKYKKAYENAKAGNKIRTFFIIILFVVIAVMVGITYKSQYSVFTYFTNYKENMKNEILNEYENWESDLNKREKKVKEKEQQLEQQQKQSDQKESGN